MSEQFLQEEDKSPKVCECLEIGRTLAPSELYWVIEQGSPAEYYVTGRSEHGIEWTSDHAKATRFAKEESARMTVYWNIAPTHSMTRDVRVCSHINCGGPAPAKDGITDEQRYQFLREKCEKGDLVIARESIFDGLVCWCSDDPDTAIDAAILAKS